MSLLDDFKTITGISSSVSDQFIIDYYLKPAIDRASQVCLNYKWTTITFTSGTQSYDLTNSSIASPVVASSGIESVVIDGDVTPYLQYGKDFYIQGLTTFYVVDPDRTYSGSMDFKYNAYYSKPEASPYVETDAPSDLWPALLKYAQGAYQLDQLTDGSSAAGVESKREDNLQVSYGSVDSRSQLIVRSMQAAEDMMRSINGKPRFDYIQVI